MNNIDISNYTLEEFDGVFAFRKEGLATKLPQLVQQKTEKKNFSSSAD